MDGRYVNTEGTPAPATPSPTTPVPTTATPTTPAPVAGDAIEKRRLPSPKNNGRRRVWRQHLKLVVLC